MNDHEKKQDIRRSNGVARVYVAYNARFNMIKVGVSGDPKKRISGLRGGCGCEVESLYMSLPSIKAVEKEWDIKEHFAKHRAIGEWFNGHKDEIVEYSKRICGDMEIDARCIMYIKGMPINEIAREFDVSRQAILKHLKKHGVYVHKDDIELETLLVDAPIKDTVKKKDEAHIVMQEIISKVPDVDEKKLTDSYKRIAENLYASKKGYMVKYFSNGSLIEDMNWEKISKDYPKAFVLYNEWWGEHKYLDLFNFFDEQDIFITINADYLGTIEYLPVNKSSEDVYFWININWEWEDDIEYDTRTEAESAAFERAFEILEKKL